MIFSNKKLFLQTFYLAQNVEEFGDKRNKEVNKWFYLLPIKRIRYLGFP